MATILVIDDEDVDRMLVSELLRAEGHDVVEAADGVEGIAAFEKTGVDVLITDMMMPEKDGFETISEIKRKSPDLKIMAISGGGAYNDLSSLEMVKFVGADSTLTKPISAESLIAAVNDLLA
jgi:CheY-like chemotaxis protein